MNEKSNDPANPVLTFEGKKYFINELSDEIKESIKGLQIAETQLKMHEDTLKLLSRRLRTRRGSPVRRNGMVICSQLKGTFFSVEP